MIESRDYQFEQNEMINHATQGFITFGRDFQIVCLNPVCEGWFGGPLEGRNILDLLCTDNVQNKGFLEEVFADILKESDQHKAHLYFSLIPDEILINQHNLKLSFRLLKNKQGEEACSILVMITDETEKKSLEYKLDFERRVLKMVVGFVINYKEFMALMDSFLEFAHTGLKSIYCTSETPLIALKIIMRDIHTFKGNFSQMDMVCSTEKIDEFEKKLAEFRNTAKGITFDAIKQFMASGSLEKIISDDLQLLKKILGKSFFEYRNLCVVSEEKIKGIEELVKDTLSYYDQKMILPPIQNLRYKSVKDILKDFPPYVMKLAQKVGKEIQPFEVTGDEVLVDRDKYFSVFRAMTNLFRNAVDHGIETPEKRLKTGKSEYGKINCRVTDIGEEFGIIITDDGAGIDIEKLREKAILLGRYNREDMLTKTKEDILLLVFEDDFTLSDELSSLSGRGMGLSSLYQSIKKIGGQVKVLTQLGEGTTFIITLPKTDLVKKSELTPQNVVNAVHRCTKEYFAQLHGFKVTDATGFQVKDMEQAIVGEFAGYLEFYGTLKGGLLIGVDEKLAKSLAKSVILWDFSKEEYHVLVEDIMAECANTILGNCMKHFEDIDDYFEMGLPKTFRNSKDTLFRHPNARIWEMFVNFNEGKLVVSVVFHGLK